jgi:hypothetical protein
LYDRKVASSSTKQQQKNVARKSLIKVAPVQTRVTSPAKATTNKKLHAMKHIADNKHSSTDGMSTSGYHNISKKVDAFPHTMVTMKP